MATKAQPVRIGPFIGGLNTYSDPSAIADEDAVELLNFDVDLDGSLISRPPVTATGAAGDRYNNRILGIYTNPAGDSYVIFSTQSAAGAKSTGFYNLNTGAYGNVTTTIEATAMVQFQNKAWLIAPPGSANPGGTWDGATFAAVAAMPKGETATVYKERIFIGSGARDVTNPSRVYFSGPANPSSWTGTDFFDVNNGDGQPLIAIYAYSSSIVVFKARSTYVYAYESSPTKGQVQSVSASIGLENADSFVEVENILFVLYDSDLYSVSNWNWEQQNIKVPFTYRNTNFGKTWSNFSVSTINNRVLVRYYDNIYCYGTKTRAWSLWNSTLTPHRWFKSPIVDTATGIQTFIAGNYLNNTAGASGATLLQLRDAYTAVDSELFTCRVRSKVYSFNVPYSYKRLMWWGVDLLTRSKVTAVVSPITYGRPVYIKTILGQPISNFLTRPIGSLLDISLDVTDSADIKNPSGVRMFVKYIKSLRFRQVQFSLSSDINGSTSTGPFQIYSVTAYVINKETVTKKIN